MNPRHVSSMRAGSPTEVLARPTRTIGKGGAVYGEKYGAETLPVLIRLPDLTLSDQSLDPVSTSAAPEPEVQTVIAPLAAEPESRSGRRERPVSGRARQDRHESTSRRGRGRVRQEKPVGGLHGVKQFVVAAVLAGILLAVIVTIKDWNRQAPESTSAAAGRQIEALQADFGHPELAPAANATFEPRNAPLDTVREPTDTNEEHGPSLQSVVPAGMMSFDPGPWPEAATPRRDADRPVAPEAAGYADGADSRGGAYGNYPSTDAPPVEVGSVPPSSGVGAAWPSSYDASRPVRSADSGRADSPFPPR
ncbi:MAG: hypothetical protein ACYC6N_00635 [Pirellulaceae bacterium]